MAERPAREPARAARPWVVPVIVVAAVVVLAAGVVWASLLGHLF